MPDGIPAGITREDVAQALATFDGGAEHGFGPSTGYDLIHEGRRYPPKAILGLAARRVAGRALTPYDFKGGEDSRCFRVLRELGFEVQPKPESVSHKTYILAWNPDRWTWPDFDAVVERSSRGESIEQQWSTGNTRTIASRQRVFVLRQVVDRGIIASGWTTSDVRLGDHWDGSGRQASYVSVALDRVLATQDVLPTARLVERIAAFPWGRLQSSGASLPTELCEPLEQLWQSHLAELGIVLSTEEPPAARYLEGATQRVAVNAYERNPQARRACLAHWGVACGVCGFHFGKFYGGLGEGYIHVHHLRDLATIGGEYAVDPVQDLRPVCPNCHAMLHTERPAMSIERLQTLIAARRATPPTPPSP